MAYSNIGSYLGRNPYASQSGDQGDFTGNGYGKYYYKPGEPSPPWDTGNSIYQRDRPTRSSRLPVVRLPEATMSGGISGSPDGGPAGVGGNGGFGFTNLSQYIYANPVGSGPGSGYAPVPTGYSGSDYNKDIGGFAPNGAYTLGMSGVDNALNQVYGRTSAPGSSNDPTAPVTTTIPGNPPPDPDEPKNAPGDTAVPRGKYRNIRSYVGPTV
jgi:hypothetical protein